MSAAGFVLSFFADDFLSHNMAEISNFRRFSKKSGTVNHCSLFNSAKNTGKRRVLLQISRIFDNYKNSTRKLRSNVVLLENTQH